MGRRFQLQTEVLCCDPSRRLVHDANVPTDAMNVFFSPVWEYGLIMNNRNVDAILYSMSKRDNFEILMMNGPE